MKKQLVIAIVVITVIILIVVASIFLIYQINDMLPKKLEQGTRNLIENINTETSTNTTNNSIDIATSSNSQNIEDTKISTNAQNPIAIIEVENFGTIKVELYKDKAPNTVANFIRLANRGFYDNLTFHRVIKDFMVQGGDPLGDGTGGAKLKDIKDSGDDLEYCIEGEFSKNGYKENNVKFERGVIGMARADYSGYGLAKEGYNSGSSQFFIMHASNSNLNGLYTAFGKVIEGIEVVDKIANIEIDQETLGQSDKPVSPPVIKKITVETNGVDYGEPKTLEKFDFTEWMMQQYTY